MQRRRFIKTTSLLTLPLILKSCDWLMDTMDFPIQVDSDMESGHMLLKPQELIEGASLSVDTLIVGGGLAGLSAAVQLKGRDFLLCELSENLGGSSSASEHESVRFARGAHYDLAYPDNYGEEVLTMLESLGIVKFHPWKHSWGFRDEQHVVMHRRKNRCFDHGSFRNDVLADGEMKRSFLALLDQYSGKMPLPTRMISKELHHLNQESFLDFLKRQMKLDQKFITGLDYHMKDDYGAGASVVSALAGIHYFKCRPYYNEIVELFSPPTGNYYFIEKMKAPCQSDQILTGHMVAEIDEQKDSFRVKLVDIKNRTIKTVNARKIIYAGQKHALKYVFPKAYKYFNQNRYAPWMVVNVVVDNSLPGPAFWQNEMLTSDETFLGFVDSNAQAHQNHEYRILTAYYCLPESSRNDLVHADANKHIIARKTVDQISTYFGQGIGKKVRKVYIKVMGHAMPIPVPGYLFRDKNQNLGLPHIAFAGVDNARLPLLFEAIDSGITAVKRLQS